MSEPLIFTSAGILALLPEEQLALKDFLDAHDRGGFYMAYNAIGEKGTLPVFTDC